MAYAMHGVQIPHARHENYRDDDQFTQQQQADLEAQVRFRQQVHDSHCTSLCACMQFSPDAIRYTCRCVGSSTNTQVIFDMSLISAQASAERARRKKQKQAADAAAKAAADAARAANPQGAPILCWSD